MPKTLHTNKSTAFTIKIADLENYDGVWPVVLELTQEISHKLRSYRKCTQGVAVHVRDNRLQTRQWQTRFEFPTQSTRIIAKEAAELFQHRYQWHYPIRSITVQAIELVDQDAPCQISLLVDTEKLDKLNRLEECVEDIRRRFGRDSIRNCVLCQNLQSRHAPIVMPSGVTV